MKIYVSGAMSGAADFNFPAFREATRDLRAGGHQVWSPAEMDEHEGFSPAPGGEVDASLYAHFLARDIQLIAREDIDTIVVLPGWEDSAGVRAELAFADALDLQVLSYPDLKPLFKKAEIRVINEETGGAKGQKQARMDLLPWDSLVEIAEVFGFGASKYEDRNWERGYNWGLSFAAMQRHLAAHWSGEDLDPESGLPHLAHAGFHILALLRFRREHPALDDRKVA